MNKKLAVVSVGYWFGAHSLGLLLHPYQSMRRVVREELYKPLVMLPLVSMAVWWMVGFVVSRIEVLASVGLVFLVEGVGDSKAVEIVMSFGFAWGVVSLLLWQGMLGYLYWRFRKVM